MASYPPRPPPIPERRAIGSLSPASKGAADALVDSRDGCHKLVVIDEVPSSALDLANTPRVTPRDGADTSHPAGAVAASKVETACDDDEVMAGRDESDSNGRVSERIQTSDNTKESREQPSEKARVCGPEDEITWDAFDKRGDEPPELTLIPTDEILGDCQERDESISLDESSTNGRESASHSREVRDDYHL